MSSSRAYYEQQTAAASRAAAALTDAELADRLGAAAGHEADIFERVALLHEAARRLRRRSGEGYRTRTGRVLTDADIEELADEAEDGYDPGGRGAG